MYTIQYQESQQLITARGNVLSLSIIRLCSPYVLCDVFAGGAGSCREGEGGSGQAANHGGGGTSGGAPEQPQGI